MIRRFLRWLFSRSVWGEKDYKHVYSEIEKDEIVEKSSKPYAPPAPPAPRIVPSIPAPRRCKNTLNIQECHYDDKLGFLIPAAIVASELIDNNSDKQEDKFDGFNGGESGGAGATRSFDVEQQDSSCDSSDSSCDSSDSSCDSSDSSCDD